MKGKKKQQKYLRRGGRLESPEVFYKRIMADVVSKWHEPPTTPVTEHFLKRKRPEE
jgi:hypothetical protein